MKPLYESNVIPRVGPEVPESSLFLYPNEFHIIRGGAV